VFVATADTVADRLGAGRDAVAFCFPGQGSQRPGMVADLVVAFPGLRRWVRAGAPWADLMLPPAAFGTEARRAQQAALTDTRVAQPALGVAGLVVADLLTALGVRPAMAAGHSYGELVALALAGSIEPDALLALSAARAEAILGAAGDDPGAMASVSADVDAVRGALAAAEVTDVVVANHNARHRAGRGCAGRCRPAGHAPAGGLCVPLPGGGGRRKDAGRAPGRGGGGGPVVPGVVEHRGGAVPVRC
jgi:acyl transferase domain-containing protein